MKSTKLVMLAALLMMTACSSSFSDVQSFTPECMGPSNRDVVRDESNGSIVHSTSGACVRTKWVVDHDVCGTGPAMMSPLSKEDQTVYFGFNEASLSPDMIARLDSLADRLKSSGKVKAVRIVGFADRIGNAGYNEKLSKKRAENVRQYLVAKGLVTAKLARTRWVGSKDAKAKCADSLKRTELIDCLKTDRRVEVEVDYASDKPKGK